MCGERDRRPREGDETESADSRLLKERVFFPVTAEAFKVAQINITGICTWFCLNP